MYCRLPAEKSWFSEQRSCAVMFVVSDLQMYDFVGLTHLAQEQKANECSELP